VLNHIEKAKNLDGVESITLVKIKEHLSEENWRSLNFDTQEDLKLD
jgi:hypothetical protein